jgi:hypothetical protein
LHPFGATDDAAPVGVAREGPPQVLSLLFFASLLDACGDALQDKLVLKRLADAPERATLPSGNRRIERGVSRDHQDDRFGVRLLYLFERAQAPHAGHRDIEQNYVVGLAPVTLQALFARACEIDAIPFSREQRL